MEHPENEQKNPHTKGKKTWRKKKHLFISLPLILLIAAFSIFWVFKPGSGNEPLTVTDTVLQETIEYRVKVNGITEALQEQKAYTQTAGTVGQIYVQAGDQVREGQVLATLHSAELDQKLAEAQIKVATEKTRLDLNQENLENAKLNLTNLEGDYKLAQSRFNANQELYEHGAVSKTDLETSQVEMDQAYTKYLQEKNTIEKGQLNQEIKLQNDQYNLANIEYKGIIEEKDKLSILSPINGMVGEVYLKMGEPAQAEKEAFYIVDNSQVVVKANVGEYDALHVKIGDPFQVSSLGSNDQVYPTTVSFISPYAKKITNGQITQTIVEVKGFIEGETSLKSGLTVSIDILCARKENALTVPYESVLTTKDGDRYIFIQDEALNITSHKIQSGIEGALRMEILSEEIQAGDAVILNPSEELLTPGAVKAGADV